MIVIHTWIHAYMHACIHAYIHSHYYLVSTELNFYIYELAFLAAILLL